MFQRNVCLMTPWILMTGIGLVLQIGSIIMVTSLGFGSAIGDIFAWVLGAYFFLVVWSYKAEVEEGRGPRALHAQLSSSPSSTSTQPSAPVSPTDPLLLPIEPLGMPTGPLSMSMPSLPPSYNEAVSTPNTPLYPCDPPKYTELPEGGSTSVTR